MIGLSNKAIATDGRIITNYANGSNPDIIKVIHNNLERATAQVKDIAPTFKGQNNNATARNIFNFLKTNINYSADGDTQKIKLPGRFVAEAVGDCKSYSLFTAAILNALNIPFAFRYASYNPTDSTPQHVYIIATPESNPIVIDAVNQLPFNTEKHYTYKKDYIMRIQTISGVPAQPVFIGGWLNDQWNKIKDVGAEIIDKAKTVAFAVPRGAYLLLLNINAFGFSTYLNALLEKNPTKLKDKWNSLGGNFTELKNAINNGRNKKPLFNKNASISGPGIGEPTTVAASIAAATAIIAAMAGLLAEGKKLFGKVLPGDPETPAPGPGSNNQPPPPAPDNKMPFLLIGAAALAFIALKK
jgi:hypothetical protein